LNNEYVTEHACKRITDGITVEVLKIETALNHLTTKDKMAKEEKKLQRTRHLIKSPLKNWMNSQLVNNWLWNSPWVRN